MRSKFELLTKQQISDVIFFLTNRILCCFIPVWQPLNYRELTYLTTDWGNQIKTGKWGRSHLQPHKPAFPVSPGAAQPPADVKQRVFPSPFRPRQMGDKAYSHCALAPCLPPVPFFLNTHTTHPRWAGRPARPCGSPSSWVPPDSTGSLSAASSRAPCEGQAADRAD